MNKFSIVLTLLLCGSCALALDPNLEKTKSATGIDLPTAKWNLPKELNEDGTIDETKMLKNSEYSKMVIFWEIKFLMKQANMWVHKPKILKKICGK